MTEPPTPDREDGAQLLQDAPTRFPRQTLEFERAWFFSDAVFAIALTLLVVGIAVPTVRQVADSSEMWDALTGLQHEFISFFVGFAVLGRYWLAHHRFVAALDAVDQPLMTVNLVYLAFIAFAPFPTALVGRYEENLVSFAFFALVLAILSFLETVLFLVAGRRHLLRFVVTRDVAEHGLVSSFLPVAVFLVSIPVALLTTSTIGLLFWFTVYPLEALLDRLWPVRRDVSPQRDFHKVANSITRDALPAGMFNGKAKQLYDCLYSLTRGAIVPSMSVRISRAELMKKSGIGAKVTLEQNLRRLTAVFTRRRLETDFDD